MTSCRLYLESSIINKCKANTEVIIQFDKDLFSYLLKDTNSYYKFIDKMTERNNNIERISLDTINLITYYRLNPKDTFYIKPAIKFWNDTLYFLKKVSFINKNDTIMTEDYLIFDAIFFNSNDQYNPFKLEDYYFRELDQQE